MSILNGLLTYGDVSRKEDVVLNAVELLTAEENTVLNKLGKTTAIDTVHSFLVDSLSTPASKAVAMNTDFALSAQTTPTRLTNLVEEIAEAMNSYFKRYCTPTGEVGLADKTPYDELSAPLLQGVLGG